jgi:nickel transport protein
MMKKFTFQWVVTVTVFILVTALPCLAHKIRVFAWQEHDQVIAEAKFSGGRPALGVEVTVSDLANGEVLVTGSTDTAGRWAFPLPQNHQAVEVVVDSGDGHRAAWTLHLDTPVSRVPPDNPAPAATAGDPKETPSDTGEALLTTPLNEAQLRELISEVITAELAPIKRTLAESSESAPTLQDILGAIGYILGLAGIAAYLHSRKNNQGAK